MNLLGAFFRPGGLTTLGLFVVCFGAGGGLTSPGTKLNSGNSFGST